VKSLWTSRRVGARYNFFVAYTRAIAAAVPSDVEVVVTRNPIPGRPTTFGKALFKRDILYRTYDPGHFVFLSLAMTAGGVSPHRGQVARK